MSLASSAWILVLIFGIVLLLVFLAIYWNRRNGELGTWNWALLFLALFVILLAFILQLALGRNGRELTSETIYRNPGWIERSQLMPYYYQGMDYCPPSYPRGLTLSRPSDGGVFTDNTLPSTSGFFGQAINPGFRL